MGLSQLSPHRRLYGWWSLVLIIAPAGVPRPHRIGKRFHRLPSLTADALPFNVLRPQRNAPGCQGQDALRRALGSSSVWSEMADAGADESKRKHEALPEAYCRCDICHEVRAYFCGPVRPRGWVLVESRGLSLAPCTQLHLLRVAPSFTARSTAQRLTSRARSHKHSTLRRQRSPFADSSGPLLSVCSGPVVGVPVRMAWAGGAGPGVGAVLRQALRQGVPRQALASGPSRSLLPNMLRGAPRGGASGACERARRFNLREAAAECVRSTWVGRAAVTVS